MNGSSTRCAILGGYMHAATTFTSHAVRCRPAHFVNAGERPADSAERRAKASVSLSLGRLGGAGDNSITADYHPRFKPVGGYNLITFSLRRPSADAWWPLLYCTTRMALWVTPYPFSALWTPSSATGTVCRNHDQEGRVCLTSATS